MFAERMGNGQTKEIVRGPEDGRKLTMYMVENREYKDKLKDIFERMNAEPYCPMSLSLLSESKEFSRAEYLLVVKSLQLVARLQTDQIRSEIQLLSFLSNTFCRQASDEKIVCWFKLKDKRLIDDDADMLSECKLDVDSIAFGTLENAVSFVTISDPRNSSTSARKTYELQFQFQNRKILLTQKAGEQLFHLEIEMRHMHHIIHVVRRGLYDENTDVIRRQYFDVYFQLQYPPVMYECINVDAPPGVKRRTSRRSYLVGVTSEEIGRCDVLRVSFNTSIQDKNLLEVFSNLLEADSPRWEFRFAWINERMINDGDIARPELNNFGVLYADKVLQSVGLRCQLINSLDLLNDWPENVHEEFLYHVAELYANESQHYLVDINKVKRQWKSRQSNYSMKLRSVILTPTRIIFQRPSVYESNRVLRQYFSGDRAEYVMKVIFRDEDGEKYLNFISLLSLKGALDDQVR